MDRCRDALRLKSGISRISTGASSTAATTCMVEYVSVGADKGLTAAFREGDEKCGEEVWIPGRSSKIYFSISRKKLM